MTASPRAAIVLMCAHIALGLVQVLTINDHGSARWLRILLIAGFAYFAVGYAISYVNLRRHPELVRPYRAWWM